MDLVVGYIAVEADGLEDVFLMTVKILNEPVIESLYIKGYVNNN